VPKFKCKDIGVDCSFKAKAKTEEELMAKIAEHAKGTHNYDPIPDEILNKVKKAIK
jgi:predicted small metal-binding protein